MPKKLPKIPSLIDRKIYKTGQTRGADDDVIYQNRVSRNSTVLIPYENWINGFKFPSEEDFENGYIVLITPEQYFGDKKIDRTLKSHDLALGENLLVFYYSRNEWEKYNPESKKWRPAISRISPLGGQYVARVPASTAVENGAKIQRGFTSTNLKGAGIRVFEYASSETIKNCRIQLESLFWLCRDYEKAAVANGMSKEDVKVRRDTILGDAKEKGLLNIDELKAVRILNDDEKTVCPLCIQELSAQGFFSRMQQAEGRSVQDLTVTEVNLFHIHELRMNQYNHKPYNLGWGHHHCNVVTKDAGIEETLEWMKIILERNKMI